MSSLASLLFTDYRRRVLDLLLLHPDQRYHVREIARKTDTAAGSLHRELAKLAVAGVLLREGTSNQVYYRANRDCLIFEELASISRKTSGLVDVLADVLEPLSETIEAAFVFGSTADGKESDGSDIDLMVIGTLSFADAVTALYPAQELLGREINPKVYSMAEWKKKLRDKGEDGFIRDVLRKPMLIVVGSSDELGVVR